MLVLSRRENDRLLFPSLGISIQVVRLTSSRVSLGIQAPRQIQVIRQELHRESQPTPDQGELSAVIEAQLQRRIQGKVDSIARSLELAQQELEQGDSEAAVRRLDRVRSQLHALRSATADQACGPMQPSGQDTAADRSQLERGNTDSPWRVGRTVSESTAGYSIGCDQPSRSNRLWVACCVCPPRGFAAETFSPAATVSDHSASGWKATRARC